jgi:hypothetical protein
MPSTFSISIGGLAESASEEQELLEDFRKLAKKHGKRIHQAVWSGQTTGRHLLMEEFQ